MIDIQNTYLEPKDPTRPTTPAGSRSSSACGETVIPNTARLIAACRARGVEVIFARIACLKQDGRDRSLSQKKPGFNYLLLPKDRADAPGRAGARARGGRHRHHQDHRQRADRHQPAPDPANMGIENVVVAGIFTDQCVSSTVRSLADESFNVVVVEDCCAAATMELHRHELEIINMIYCHVASSTRSWDSSLSKPANPSPPLARAPASPSPR